MEREGVVTMGVRSFPTIIVPKISSRVLASSYWLPAVRRWTTVVSRNSDLRVYYLGKDSTRDSFL